MDLLPCPFCGSGIVGALTGAKVRDPATGVMVPDPHARLGVVGCGVCGAEGPSRWDTAEEMAVAWNRRQGRRRGAIDSLRLDNEQLRLALAGARAELAMLRAAPTKILTGCPAGRDHCHVCDCAETT